jgi:hypothetical protein
MLTAGCWLSLGEIIYYSLLELGNSLMLNIKTMLYIALSKMLYLRSTK